MNATNPSRRLDALGRDTAISRVRRTTQWVVVSAAAGAGVLIGVVAHGALHHSAGAATSPSVAGSTGSAGAPSGGGSSGSVSQDNSGSYSPPSQAPVQTYQPPQAVSGQS
ncbi:MAG TPA: hypothetical protein VKG43_07090 [Acidimicrobiales bacterium]|nr:hypothetical protein [Acidimicrobiales bacterium]